MNKAYVEQFDSIREYLQVINSRENNPKVRTASSIKHDSSRWSGTETLEEADEILRKGWIEGYNKASKMLSINTKHSDNVPIKRARPINTVVGYVPHVPNAIMGLPNSMISTLPVYKKIRVIKVFISVGVNSMVSTSESERAFIKAIRYVLDLEASGIRVELYHMAVSENSGWYNSPIVKLKGFREKLNLLKVAYFLGHPSALRRHKFKWLETIPETVPDGLYGGYGRSAKGAKYSRDIIEKYTDIKGKKVVFSYEELDNRTMEQVHNIAESQLKGMD